MYTFAGLFIFYQVLVRGDDSYSLLKAQIIVASLKVTFPSTH